MTEPDISAMTEQEQMAYIRSKLSDKWWRMNNLYMIENEQGKLVRFRLRPAQELLFRTMWYLNIILKARQLGFSTAIDIYLLDEALFNNNIKCGIIAQDLTAAGEIYRTKIEVPFDNLPGWLKAQFKVVTRRGGANGGHILFRHGSSIQVATSFRSGTVQRLHVSEHGKICAKYPEKAKEVRTGRLQGLGKLTRELRDNPREIAKRAGMITAMSLGLLAANWDDERYEALPDWDKDTNWHFFVGDQHWRIPKPFEIGVIFGTIPERMMRALGDKDTGAQFGKAVARAIGDTFALNPTPQIVKPMVEAAFNYDSFRGGPIDGPQDLAVRAEARYNEQTSLLMRELGEMSGLSPKQLEHMLIGYTGTMGSYVMAAADGLIRANRPGEAASWRADEVPLVKAVYRGTGPAKSTQHMEEFYRMLNEVNQLKRTVDQYRSEGLTDKASELLEEQGGILKSRRNLSRTQQQVRVVRNKIELIQRDKILGAVEKRRRIDELLSRRNDLVFQAVNHNRQNWE